MSKAFTREENEGPEFDEVPALASALPPGVTNYMTAAGADNLRQELARLTEVARPELVEQAKADPDAKRRLSILDQRRFQIEQSLGNAQIVSHPAGVAERVTFGATVTVRGRNGEESDYRIVGVDEADAERGTVSWLSPIARALLKAKAGERVHFKFPSGEEDLKIVAIKYE